MIDNKDARSCTTIGHTESALGRGLNGFYHSFTKYRKKYCHPLEEISTQNGPPKENYKIILKIIK